MQSAQFFCFEMFWKDGLSKKIALEYDLSCIIRKGGIVFHEKRILFFRRRKKGDLSQKISGNIIFSGYLVPILSRKQRWSSPEKMHLKMTFMVSLKKTIFILENMVFLLIKDGKKVYLVKYA